MSPIGVIAPMAATAGEDLELVESVLSSGASAGVAQPALGPAVWPVTSYLDALDAEWEGGCRRGAELWRRLRRLGFSGSVRVVTEWATRRRRAEAVGGVGLGRVPSARRLARLLTIDRDALSKADAMIVAAIEKDVPALVVARSLMRSFQTMLRAKAAKDLAAWIDAAQDSQLASAARASYKRPA